MPWLLLEEEVSYTWKRSVSNVASAATSDLEMLDNAFNMLVRDSHLGIAAFFHLQSIEDYCFFLMFFIFYFFIFMLLRFVLYKSSFFPCFQESCERW